MGNSIDKIDEGFYICGVQALNEIEELQNLGIKCILNAASMELYGKSRLNNNRLPELPDTFEVKCLECDDAEDENISVHFDAVAEFIEYGIRKGGVVVHCAAGVSRASTSCISYLMLKRHLSLEAAFLKVYAVRMVIHPNSGFWRQLQDLEAVLRVRGVELADPTEDQLQAAREVMQKDGPTMNRCNGDPMVLINQMHNEARDETSFMSHFLTATVFAEEGSSFANLQDSVLQARLVGVEVDSVSPIAEESAAAQLRCRCIPAVDSEVLREMLHGIRSVREASVEITKLPMLQGIGEYPDDECSQ